MAPSSPDNKQQTLRVIIVGGGIAGLTLANTIEKLPIHVEYVLLEGHDEIAPQVGAGIVVMPHGARILDQLGVFDELERQIVPVASLGAHDAQGRSLLRERADWPLLMSQRLAYPMGWVERRAVTRALAGGLRREGCVLAGKKVRAVEQLVQGGANVLCTDGSSYYGDIVIGADGVRSVVRSEMWKLMEKRGDPEVEKLRNAMTAEYKCLFGISKSVPGMTLGESDDMMSQDVSTVASATLGDRVFWFLFARLPRVYKAHEIPRFTDKDAANLAAEHANVPMRPGATVKLSDLWETRQVTRLATLEEADFSRWTAGAMACVGDSAHKMLTHTGAGGMLAMESASALANGLWRLLSTCGEARPTAPQIEGMLRQWEAGLRKRATLNIKAAGEAGRTEAMRTAAHRLLVPIVFPYHPEAALELLCDLAVGSGCVDYLPLPPRSKTGTMAFNPTRGIGKHESKLARAAWALPLVALIIAAVMCRSTVSPAHQLKLLGLPSHGIKAGTAKAVSVVHSVVGQAQSVSRWPSSSADYCVWYTIVLIESTRRTNRLTILRLPPIWGMLSMWIMPIFMPLYFLMHYILSPIAAFNAPDRRLTDISTYRNAVVAMPVLQLVDWTHNSSGAGWIRVVSRRELFPLWTWLVGVILARFAGRPSTIREDRLNDVTRDLPLIRKTIWAFAAASASAWQYMIWCGGQSLADLFLPTPLVLKHLTLETVRVALAEHAKWDRVFFALGSMAWIGLLMWDLKAAGMLQRSWFALALCSVCLLLAGGPGTMVGLMWLYREQTLACSGHKMAAVSELDCSADNPRTPVETSETKTM